MTTSQNPSGAPAQPGPPQQDPRHAAQGRYPQQQYGPDPRQTGPQQWAGHQQGPQPGQPGQYYDGHPQVPFGGPPFGNTRPGGPIPPAGTEAWPTAAQRSAVPQQRGGPAPRVPVELPRNGFGTTALVLGILGLLFSLIPFVGVIAWPLVILGLVFGVLGIVRVSRGKANNRGVAISGTVLSALGLLVCILYASAFASVASDISTAAPAAPVPASGEPATDSSGAFPGATANDVVGNAGDTLTVGDLQISASALRPGDSTIGQTLCADVTYTNAGTTPGSFNGGFDWKLQDPNGAALMTSLLGADRVLSAGDLAPGGTTSGTVCFDHANGDAGQFVLLFDPMNFSSERGAWLNQVG
ncbi:DUF4352 domain-containing protein [Pseudonocardia sp. NPDC046786]|uniref:DUF4190 domain-containing protein n=1 Tax=Pseudonocardia sp. NPDC046786 TaxID=3155471 RepID=UPI0033D63B94